MARVFSFLSALRQDCMRAVFVFSLIGRAKLRT